MVTQKIIYGTRAFKCPECEILVWGNFQFCPNCGECMIVQCDSCGIRWRVQRGFHFCPRCGDEYEVAETRACTSQEILTGDPAK